MSDTNILNNVELEWVKIPETTFVIKYKFEETGFSVFATNLTELFGETTDEKEIQQRFSNSNPHAEMKTKVIIKNVKLALKNILNRKEPNIIIYCSKDLLNIQLEFYINQMPFVFNLKPIAISSKKLQEFVIIPLLCHALLSQQDNKKLKKKVSELENKLHSTTSAQKSSLDSKMSSSTFSLFENNNVSDGVILDAFLEVQNGMKECYNERKKACDAYRKQYLQPSTHQQPTAASFSVKREVAELSDPSEIRYEDLTSEHAANHPIEKEEDKVSLPVPENVKTKKKKTFKF